jgi:hypothetical protein
VPSAAWSAAATSATTAASGTSAPPAISAATVWTVALRTVAAANMRRGFAVEVGLVAIRRLIRKIAAALDHHGAGGSDPAPQRGQRCRRMTTKAEGLAPRSISICDFASQCNPQMIPAVAGSGQTSHTSSAK